MDRECIGSGLGNDREWIGNGSGVDWEWIGSGLGMARKWIEMSHRNAQKVLQSISTFLFISSRYSEKKFLIPMYNYLVQAKFPKDQCFHSPRSKIDASTFSEINPNRMTRGQNDNQILLMLSNVSI